MGVFFDLLFVSIFMNVNTGARRGFLRMHSAHVVVVQLSEVKRRCPTTTLKVFSRLLEIFWVDLCEFTAVS